MELDDVIREARALPPHKKIPTMGDAEAFKVFFEEEMRKATGITIQGALGGIDVGHEDDVITLEQAVYKFMRCALVHEGALPSSVDLYPEPTPGMTSLKAGGPNNPLGIGHGYLDIFANMAVYAAENAADFPRPETKA